MPSKTRDAPRSLSDSINAATRSVHTKLNKLVISRLQLALPPQADDASQYVSGLLHIAPIYMTFESLWKSALESLEQLEEHNPGSSPNGVTCNPARAQLDDRQFAVHARIKLLLTNLYLEGMQRSQALKNDLVSLTGWSGRTLAEKLNDASESPVLSEFLAHTRVTVETSPHTLLAYGWVLYMALFSGGRFIRASLENIYPAFWVPASAQRPTPATLANATSAEMQPLSFFRFDTPEDGEDLKIEFKRRLLDLGDTLTEAEREEIIQEARCIFNYMILLVGELDDIYEKDREDSEARLLSLRSRDSVVVENERRQNSAEIYREATAKRKTERGSRESGEGHVKFG
ncbi:hypothetical protein O1611_g10122 [Lasiodiplodia mahajangana]|uniref:Uncharacterized protein n=1 Tax=Lasiodiplodia mahajangana TaxID=1108764 RepID=A0ACC2J1P2_9PEZI|nr:hypothetical protein O1611_g10122 [Lasiodiplodia mahajangana]